jgi:hypothetical protein
MRPQTYVCVSPSRGVQAISNEEYHLSRVVRCCLQENTRPHDHREDKHRPPASKSLPDEQRDDGSEKTSQIIDTCHEALHSWRRMVEVLDEILTDHDATEDTFALD